MAGELNNRGRAARIRALLLEQAGRCSPDDPGGFIKAHTVDVQPDTWQELMALREHVECWRVAHSQKLTLTALLENATDEQRIELTTLLAGVEKDLKRWTRRKK